MNQELRVNLENVVGDFCKNQKGYHCYQLEVERISDNDLMTMGSVVEGNISMYEKRKIIDGMAMRLQPEHWNFG